MANLGDRIIVLIDMDCFFCQVEVKLNPQLKDKPLAVVQYSSFGPGAIIAVNYEARDFGVTRHMRGDEAKEKCPQIELVTVPPVRNKPDTGRYRIAGKDVIDVLKKYCTKIERASVDEAYLDITDLVEKKLDEVSECNSIVEIINSLSNSFVVGYCDNESNDEEKRQEGVERWVNEAFDDLGDVQARKLAIAGTIVEELREQIYAQCEYRCSAGISYNKILAKLACGLHKPNRQTILPAAGVPSLFSTLPVKKVRNLGGKFGNCVIESMGCNVMADLLRFPLQDLQRRFDEKAGLWLYNIARGIDNEPVVTRLICKSIGSSKNFPGKMAINNLNDLKRWVDELASELAERLEDDLEENQRRATSLTVSYHYYAPEDAPVKKIGTQSRVCSLPSYKCEKIASICLDVLTKGPKRAICLIAMSAGKFVPNKGSGNFVNFFKTKATTSSGNDKIVPDVDKDSQVIDNEEKKINHADDCLQVTNVHEKDNIIKSVPVTVENDNKMDDSGSKVEKNGNNQSRDVSNCAGTSTTINEHHIKSSFFINFLKDSRTSSLPSTSTAPSSESSNNINTNSTSTEQEQESPDLFDDSEYQADSTSTQMNGSKKEIETANTVCKDNPLTQLQEIFPDLDNIDLSVVQLLPIELQRAANIYLKSKKPISPPSKNSTKSSTNKVKVNKTKSVASKGAIKNNSLHNFLVKNNSPSDNSTMKKCPDCCQMIKEEKFPEHADFHVAQNLQRFINQSVNDEGKNSTDSVSTSMKRKSNMDSSTMNKRPRNIESFFT